MAEECCSVGFKRSEGIGSASMCKTYIVATKPSNILKGELIQICSDTITVASKTYDGKILNFSTGGVTTIADRLSILSSFYRFYAAKNIC